MSRTISLVQQVQIAAPCHAKWEDMTGDDRVRFCDSCKLNVYNLSAMSEEEGETLIRNTEGRLCARLYRRADGTILAQNCPAGLRAFSRRVAWVSARLAAALGFIITSAAYSMSGRDTRENETSIEMGYAIRPRESTTFEKAVRTVNRWIVAGPPQQSIVLGRLSAPPPTPTINNDVANLRPDAALHQPPSAEHADAVEHTP